MLIFSKSSLFRIIFFVIIFNSEPLSAQTNYKKLADETFQEIIKDPSASGNKINLLKAIPASEPDSIKYFANACLGVYYGMILQHDSANKYFLRALSLVEPNSIQWAKTNHKLAIIKRQEGKYNEALTMLSRAGKITQLANDHLISSMIFSEMASNYHYLYNQTATIEFLLKSIEEIEKMAEPNQLQLAVQKHNLANFYSQNKDFDLADKLYEEGLLLFKKADAKQHIALTLMNHGESLLKQKKYVVAERMIREGLAKLELLGNKEWVAICYLNLAILYQETSKAPAIIIKNYLLSLNEASAVSSPRTLEILNNYLSYLNERGLFNEVVLLGTKYEAYKEMANIETLHHFYGIMGKAYAGKGAFEAATKNYELHSRYGDSLMVSDKDFLVSQIHENYSQELHKKEIKSLQQANQIMEQESRLKLFLFLSAVSILLCIAIYSWSKMNKIRHNNKVSTLKIEMEENLLKQAQQVLQNEQAEVKMKKDIIEMQKNELLQLSQQGSVIMSKIDAFMLETSSEQSDKTSHSIKEAINNQFFSLFNHRFKIAFPNFYSSIHTKFGAIFTEEELQHMALHKLELGVSEIADALSISAVQAELIKKNILKKCAFDQENLYNSVLKDMA